MKEIQQLEKNVSINMAINAVYVSLILKKFMEK